MLVICSAVDRSLHTKKDARRQKKIGSIVLDRDVSHPDSETLFALVGKSVYIQKRFSFVPSNRETTLHFTSQNKNYSSFTDDVLQQTKRETKINTKTISGGVQSASVHRRQEHTKPSTDVVYQKKSESKNQCVTTIRQPLVMCAVNFPDKHLPYEEAPQIFSSTEDANVILKRLLACTDKCMMAETVSTGNVRQEKKCQSGLLEKPEYLAGTYDYLFHRHVQTLHDVILQQELQESDEARGIHQQKNHKQVIQLCCGNGIDCDDDDASAVISSTKSSCHHNASTVCYHSSRCDGTTGSNSQDCDRHYINGNNFFASPSSCDEYNDKVMNGQCEVNKPRMVNDNNETGSCHYIQNNGDSSINLKAVTRQVNALKLQEVKSSPKPIITIDHVSTVHGNSSTDTETVSQTLEQITTTSNSSTFRSRCSSPLLEVPVPLEDLTAEMKRPPLN